MARKRTIFKHTSDTSCLPPVTVMMNSLYAKNRFSSDQVGGEGWGEGVLSYARYTAMCSPRGFGFWATGPKDVDFDHFDLK